MHIFTHHLAFSQRPKTRPSINREVSNEFRPSAWITDFIPRKSPFVPQMGDEVCSRNVGRMFTLRLFFCTPVLVLDKALMSCR